MTAIIGILIMLSINPQDISIGEKNCRNKYFEGFVVYGHQYEPDSLANHYGTESTFYFKNGNYKQVFDKGKVRASVYNRTQNLIYTVLDNDTIVTSGDKQSETIKSHQIFEHNSVILGEECDLLVLRTNRRTTYYFFNKKYSVDPKVFKDHKYSSLSFVYSKTESIPLKIVTHYEDFSVTITATKIRKGRVDEIFNVN